jgi:hypothetical protein
VKSFAAPWLRGLAVVVALGTCVVAASASAQTADCQAEAESVSGAYGSSSTGGALPGSVSGSGEPGASNAGTGDRESLRAMVYDDCQKRRGASAPRPRLDILLDTSVPDPAASDASPAKRDTLAPKLMAPGALTPDLRTR